MTTKFTLEIEISGPVGQASGVLHTAMDDAVLQQHIDDSAAVSVESAAVTEETELGEKLTRFTVEIEIDGDGAAEALDDALDAGVLQEFIDDRGVTVESAVVTFVVFKR